MQDLLSSYVWHPVRPDRLVNSRSEAATSGAAQTCGHGGAMPVAQLAEQEISVVVVIANVLDLSVYTKGSLRTHDSQTG
jgi:hypothetical protein